MSNLMTRNSLFDEFFKDVAPGFFIKPLHGDPLPAASKIKVDVKENEKGFVVHADIPGVDKQDIHVSVDGNVVHLRAEIRQQDSQAEGEKVLRSERYYGEVSRSFQLPADIDEAGARARYDNGVLVLDLPRKMGSTPQRLTID